MKIKEIPKEIFYLMIAVCSIIVAGIILCLNNNPQKSNEEKIIGNWICSSGDYIEFFEDGSFESSELSSLKHSSGAYPWENNDIDEIYTGTYDYDNNTVTFFYSCTRHDWIDNEKKTVQYIIDKGALKLTNGYDTDIFEKGN